MSPQAGERLASEILSRIRGTVPALFFGLLDFRRLASADKRLAEGLAQSRLLKIGDDLLLPHLKEPLLHLGKMVGHLVGFHRLTREHMDEKTSG